MVVVCHVNVCSLAAEGRLSELKCLVAMNGVDILCLTETWLKSKHMDSSFLLPGFQPPPFDKIAPPREVVVWLFTFAVGGQWLACLCLMQPQTLNVCRSDLSSLARRSLRSLQCIAHLTRILVSLMMPWRWSWTMSQQPTLWYLAISMQGTLRGLPHKARMHKVLL